MESIDSIKLIKILELEKENPKRKQFEDINKCFKKTTFEEILQKFAKTAKEINFPLEIIENTTQIEAIYWFYDITSKNPSKSAKLGYLWDCLDYNHENPLKQALLRAKIPTKIIQTEKQRQIAYKAIINRK